MSKDNNKILINSKALALRMIKLYKYLTEEKAEHVLSKQILRSGTSIGANIRESINAQSHADFINKMSIALKEANETEYWLELLHDSEFISDKEFESIYADTGNVVGTLVNIIKTAKSRMNVSES